jgi:hypothetical protein
MELYQSRLQEENEAEGDYTTEDAIADYHRYLLGERTDYTLELSHQDKKRIHNLKYYTWVEQQGKTYEEIMEQWESPTYWSDIHGQVGDIDEMITEFNAAVGLY